MRKYNAQHIPVQNPGIQDTCTLDNAICLRQSLWRTALFHSLSIITLGFFWLLGYWSPKLRSKLTYNQCSIHQTTHFMVYNWDSKWSILPREDMLIVSSKSSHKQSITFNNRNIRYFYDEMREVFTSYKYDIVQKIKQLKKQQIYVYPQSDRNLLHRQFGRCVVEVKVSSRMRLFLSQMLTPYQVFQFYAIVYWLITQYYIFPIILLIVSIFYTIYDIQLLQKAQQKLRSDSLIATVISYITKNEDAIQLKKAHSEIIVPGDLFYITQKQKLPCDCLIIKGSAFINEEYFTGNPLPCHKSQLYNMDYNPAKQQDSILYMGTQITYIDNEDLNNNLPNIPVPEYKAILCLAIRTNYSSIRGQFLRNILYPKPQAFKLFTESVSFLVIMFLINIVGFIIIMLKVKDYIDSSRSVVLFLDLLTTAIPPTLPAAMSVGIEFATRRLKVAQIQCMVKQKIIIGGRVDTVMIQHTNLLRRIKINVLGFIHNIPYEEMQLKLIKDVDISKNVDNNIVLEGMATAHSLCKSNISGQNYLGTLTDVEIIRFLKAEIQDGNQTILLGQRKLKIQEKVHIESNLIQVKISEQNTQSKRTFIRGNCTTILQLCDKSTLSTNIEEATKRLTSNGYLLLALAYYEGTKRCEAQNKNIFQFLGYIVVEQKRQYNSPSTIQTLGLANIHTIILSKQNSAHAVHAAAYCGLLPSSKDLMYYQLSTNSSGYKKIQRTYHDSINADSQNLSSAGTEDDLTKEIVLSLDQSKPLQICMSGYVLEELYNRKNIQSLKFIFQKVIIFCELQQKHYSMIIQTYRELKHLVTLVGDNVRDNGFKQSDIGLALTSNQLSCLSHFSAKKSNLDSVVSLLRIAKASLSCNFQTFRMMCLFSLTQFTTYVLLYLDYQELNDSQNLYVDLFIMCPIFVCLSLTQPCTKLTKQKPSASLFSIENVLSMTGLFLIQLVAQIMVMRTFKSQKYLWQYEADSLQHILATDQFNEGTYEITNLFVFSNFLYIGIALATSVSKPFRKQFYTNIPLALSILILWVYNIIIPFDSLMIPESMEIRHLHGDWVVSIIIAANLVCVIMYVYEYLVLGLTKKLRTKWCFE